MFEQPTKSRRHAGSHLFMGICIALLAVGVVFVILVCRTYFHYQRYERVLEFTFGSTSQVVATLEDGTRVRLSDHNRRTFHGMLTDSSGLRREMPRETGESFAFYANSAAGICTGEVADAGEGWVYVHLSYEDESWDYYFNHRSDYDTFRQTVSPEGWLTENTVLKSKVEG